MNIVISCGGTGGHMFPGLAVAEELLRRGHAVTILFSGRSVESAGNTSAIPKGAETHQIPALPISVKSPRSIWVLARGILRAKRLFRKIRPDTLLCMGSYTSMAPGIAARCLGIPIVLHEANAIPGKAVNFLSRFSSAVCTTFPEVEKCLPKAKKFFSTGIPLRGEFSPACAGTNPAPGKKTLLVMGGSQGARDVNALVLAALRHLEENNPDAAAALRVIHLSGKANEADVKARYQEAKLSRVSVEVIGFCTEMHKLYEQADACISRAGASACFEIASCRLPALLIPLEHVANNHQVKNAESFKTCGAALMARQSDLSGKTLSNLLLRLLSDEPLRASLRTQLEKLPRPDAAARVADAIESAF